MSSFAISTPLTSWRVLRKLQLIVVISCASTATAMAQTVDPTAMGQGFFAYARPYVIWAGAGMVLLCVAAATFFKHLLKDALITAGIVVMLVFLFNTFPDLVRALSH